MAPNYDFFRRWLAEGRHGDMTYLVRQAEKRRDPRLLFPDTKTVLVLGMNYYRENSIIRHGADPKDVDIDLNGKIIVGKFIDTERPTYSDLQEQVTHRAAATEAPKSGTAKKEATASGSTPKK